MKVIVLLLVRSSLARRIALSVSITSTVADLRARDLPNESELPLWTWFIENPRSNAAAL